MPEPRSFPISLIFLVAYVGCMAFWSVTLPDEVIGNFFHDDAIFYLKTARNIADGLGSTFDGIEKTNGYHVLWMVLLVPFAKLCPLVGFAGLRPLLPVHALIVSTVCLLIDRFLASLRVAALWRAVAMLAIVLCVGFTDVGIEAPVLLLAAWGFLVCFARLLVDPSSRRYRLLVAGCAAGTALARTDAAIVPAIAWGVFTVFAVVGDDRDAKRMAPLLFALCVVPAVLAAGAVGLHNRLHFGHFATVSSHLKTHWPGTFATGWFQTAPRSIQVRLLGASALAIVALPILVHRQRDTARDDRQARSFELALLAGSCYVLVHAASILLMASGLTGSWYYALSLTLVIATVAYLTARWIERLGRAFVVVASLLLVTLSVTAVVFIKAKRFATSDVRQRQYDVSAWIKSNLPKGSVLFQVDHAGFVGYLSERQVINGDGLVNSWEYQDAVKADRIGDYLTEHRVGWIVAHETAPDGTFVVLVPRWDGAFVRVGAAAKSRALYMTPDRGFGVFRREDVQ